MMNTQIISMSNELENKTKELDGYKKELEEKQEFYKNQQNNNE